MAEHYIPGAFPKPRFRYSPMVRAGGMIYVAGMIALDPEQGGLVPGGPGAETDRILRTLAAGLAELGLGLSAIVRATIYTTQYDRIAEINAAWEAHIGAQGPPARTALGVVALPLDASVEIDFVVEDAA